MVERVRDEVREELARTAGAEVEATRFARAEEVFLGVLKNKVDLLNAAQERYKALREEKLEK